MTKLFQQAAGVLIFLIASVLISSVARADWRDNFKVLTLGFVGGERPKLAIRHIEPFRHAMQQALGISVRVIPTLDYAGLVRAQENGRIDYGVYSAASFAAATVRCKCIEPLAAAMLEGGVKAFYSILLVKKDAAKSIEQLHGKRVSAPGKGSLTGYILPVKLLAAKGVIFSEDPSDSTQNRVIIAGSAEKALDMLIAGEVDGMFGWSTLHGFENMGYSAGTLKRLKLRKGVQLNDYSIIWKSGQIANGPHAISSKVPSEAKEILISFLTGLYDKNPAAYDAVENYRSGGFARVKLSDYQLLIDLVTPPADKEQSGKDSGDTK